MIGLLVKVGFMLNWAALASGPVTTAPTTGPGLPNIFLDRFGGVWYQGRMVEDRELVRAIGKEKNPGGELVLIYDPFSLEVDRREWADFFKKEFPNQRITLRAFQAADRVGTLMFPGHQPAVQAEILSRRNVTWEEFVDANRQLADRAQSYLTAVLSQWSKARLNLNGLQHEYQHLTTRSAPKASGPVTRNELNKPSLPRSAAPDSARSNQARD